MAPFTAGFVPCVLRGTEGSALTQQLRLAPKMWGWGQHLQRGSSWGGLLGGHGGQAGLGAGWARGRHGGSSRLGGQRVPFAFPQDPAGDWGEPWNTLGVAWLQTHSDDPKISSTPAPQQPKG